MGLQLPFSFLFGASHRNEEGDLRGGFLAPSRKGEVKTYHVTNRSGTGHGSINEALVQSLLVNAGLNISEVTSPESSMPCKVNHEEFEAVSTDSRKFRIPTSLLNHCPFIEQVFGLTSEDASNSEYWSKLSDEFWALLIGNPVTNPTVIRAQLSNGNDLCFEAGRGTQFFDMQVNTLMGGTCVSIKSSVKAKKRFRVSTISAAAAEKWYNRIQSGERMPVVPTIKIWPAGKMKTVEMDGNVLKCSDDVAVHFGNVDWSTAQFEEKSDGTFDVTACLDTQGRKPVRWSIGKNPPKTLIEWLRK